MLFGLYRCIRQLEICLQIAVNILTYWVRRVTPGFEKKINVESGLILSPTAGSRNTLAFIKQFKAPGAPVYRADALLATHGQR